MGLRKICEFAFETFFNYRVDHGIAQELHHKESCQYSLGPPYVIGTDVA
jgi:hypothetical protein